MSVVLLVPVYLTADAVSMRQEAEPSTTLATAPVKAPWTLEIPDDVRWMPHFAGASSESLNTYAAGENVVELFVAYYARQTQGAELVNDENAIADTSEWTLESEQDRSVVIDGKRVSVRESAMRSPAGNHRLIWQWYWIDGQFTSNPYRVKFLQAKTKLLGGPLAAAAMTVSTVSKRAGSDAAAMMQDFLNHAVVTPRL
jgi:EpsI family protein